MPASAFTPSMPLSETLVTSDTTSVLISFLVPSRILPLATTCTDFHELVRGAFGQLRLDCPVPCDSLQEAQGFPCCKWSLGGPVPPDFIYLSEATHAFEDPGSDDPLEGCACFGTCDRGMNGSNNCGCVQLNAAVQR